MKSKGKSVPFCMTSAVNLLGDVETSRTHVALIHFLRTVDHQHKEANYSTSHGLQHRESANKASSQKRAE